MPYARPPSLWLRPAAVAAATATLLYAAGNGASWLFKKETPGGADGTRNLVAWSGTGANPPGIAIRENSDLTGSGRILSESGGTIGWTIQTAANQNCLTTCTHACVIGWHTGASGTGSNLVNCSDATADACLCAGSN